MDKFIEKSVHGYIAGYSYYNGSRRVYLYIRRIYNNNITYTTDHAHARQYKAQAAATKALERI